jgi:ADP-ribose pyrophosphatase YjhB (NUDIX family)
MEPGETIAETIVREVREETGIEATVEKLLGVYSNPRHVSVDNDGEVRQQSVCFLCRAVAGEPWNRNYWRYPEELESLRRRLERRSRHA